MFNILSKVLGGVSIVLIIFCYFLYTKNIDLSNDVALLENEIAIANNTIKFLQENKNKLIDELEENEKQRELLDSQRRSAWRKLDEAKKTDKILSEWGDSKLPNYIINELRSKSFNIYPNEKPSK